MPKKNSRKDTSATELPLFKMLSEPDSNESNTNKDLSPEDKIQQADAELRQKLPGMTVTEMEAEIHRHNLLYNAGKPEISDAMFDILVDTLQQLSPTSKAPDELTSPEVAGQGDVIHETPMLSLRKPAKKRVFEEIRLWLEKFDGDVIATPKIDGLSCSLVYDENGNLKQASTRGDGRVGKDVTPQARYIQNIPKHIRQPGLEVRGEVYMPLSAFNAFQGEKISARNLAVGGLKQKDAQQTAKYNLSFFAYEALGIEFNSDEEKFAQLRELGFTTPETHILHRKPVDIFSSDAKRQHDESLNQLLDDIRRYCDEKTESRNLWDFDADGLVFKVNDNRVQKEMGVTDHHPRCAIAFKFPCMEAQSILRDVAWQVAKGASITPVGIFDAVELAGAMVQKATLSNAGMVQSFPTDREGITPRVHLRIGSKIQVSRRGDVIPHIEYAISSPEDAELVKIPEFCPSCGSPVIRDGLFLKCSDPDNCPATGQALIENYTKVTECMGFGSKIIESLYDAGKLSTPADLYRLTPDDIAEIISQSDEGKSRSDAILPQKLYRAVQDSRVMPLSKFLEALSIPVLGHVKSRDLANHYKTLEAILSASPSDLQDVIRGEKTSQAICRGLQQRRALIHDLLQYIEIENLPEPQANNSENNIFSGKSVLFTGSLSSMKREEAQARIEKLGGTAASGVNKKLSILVATEKTTSKWQKAEALNEKGAGILLWTEEEFLEALRKAENG